MAKASPIRTSRSTAAGPVPGAPIATRYDALLIDLDGVVYRGDDAVPRSAETIRAVRRLGVRLLFLTNNSARTPEQVAAKLERIGVRVDPGEILTSASATAAMLRRDLSDRGSGAATAFVIGERGIRQALSAAGISVLDGDPARADLVVVGWDRGVDYSNLRTAALLVQRGARLVATNSDASYPAPDGLWPGAGAILAAVTTATGATPVVVGKPHRPLFEAAAEATGAGRPLVVGDRLDTDIAGAANMGWDSLLVLTGAATPADLAGADALPTYVGSDLSSLLEEVPPARLRAAAPTDTPAIEEMLETSGLSASGTAERIPSTVVLAVADEGAGRTDAPGPSEPTKGLLATATVEELHGEGYLRSVAVRDRFRGRGVGMLVAAAALRLARSRGFRRVFLFTETAESFFARLGFRRVDRDDLPEAVRTSHQALQECTASAAPMVLDL